VPRSIPGGGQPRALQALLAQGPKRFFSCAGMAVALLA